MVDFLTANATAEETNYLELTVILFSTIVQNFHNLFPNFN